MKKPTLTTTDECFHISLAEAYLCTKNPDKISSVLQKFD